MPAIDSVQVRNQHSLSDLLGGDEAKVLRVLRAFHSAANHDLLQLDGAVRDGNGALVRQIASRLAMACHLVGEADAGHCLDALAKTGNTRAIDPVMTQHIVRARNALIESIARIAMHVESSQSDTTDGGD